MSVFNERIKQDLIKLNQLSLDSNGKIKIISSIGNPVSKIVVELKYPTAINKNYPNEIQDSSRITINLTSRYPFTEPSVSFERPIVFHPNIYDSGRICLGTKWLPTQGLDLLIKRIIKIITYEPDILNEASPANGNALSWYRRAFSQYPNSFPTTKVIQDNISNKSKMNWNNLT